jgi:hypothetical protein
MAAAAATSGGLTSTFNKFAMGALKLATIGLCAAVFWQVLMDPIFFPLIHDPTNLNMQAWVMFVNDYLGWIPQILGFAKEPGLLSGPMDSLLASRKELLQIPSTESVGNLFSDGLSFDALSSVVIPGIK